MYWGGTVKGSVYGMEGEAPSAPAVWERFERDAGKEATFVNTGQNWAQFDTATMQAAIAGGAIPLVTMGLPSGVTLQEVAEGKQDAQIRAWAKKAKEFGYPFMFRPWREMNGAWYSWGRDPHYVEAWRHFHDVVEEEGATNVTWAWIVNTIWSDPESDPTPYYPGDAYVDWVGMDAYNWGRNPIQPDIWLSPEQAIGPTLEVLEKIAPNKPVALTEVASTEHGGSKASWIRDFLGSYLPDHPKIKAMFWFNWNIPEGALQYDWPIESSVTAEQAFRDGIQTSEYLSELPPLTPLAKVPMPSWQGPAEAVGTGPGPNVLADGIWSPAVELGVPGGDERGTEIAVGPSGEVTAVWERFDGSHWVVLERRIGEGGSPLGPVHQLSASGGDAFDARVVVGPDGTATVVWKRFDGSDYVIQERRVDPGGTPEASVHDLSLPGQFAGEPQVAARPDGGVVVVWERHNTSRDVTRIQSAVVRPTGVPTACCFDLTDAPFNRNSFEPQVAVAPDNSAIVVWDRHDGSDGVVQVVQARRLAPSGTPDATTYELSASGEDSIEPDLAIGPSGQATVTWTRFDGSSYVVQARRLKASGEPEATTFDVSEAGGPAVQPHIVALPDGSASVVWKQLDSSTFTVEERRLGPDGEPATTYSLSAPGADAHEPQVAVGADGSETVVWDLSEGGGTVVQARRIGPDGNPAAATAGLSDGGASAGAPFVAAGGSSSAAVAWRRFDGVHDHVQLAVFGVPAASLDPGSHDFGSLVVGAGSSQPQSFTIGNSGSTALQISSIALEGAGAAQFQLQDPSSCGSALLSPGATCQVSVSFKPTAVGSFQAQLRVNSNAYFGTGTGSVEGIGLEPSPGAGSEGGGAESGSGGGGGSFTGTAAAPVSGVGVSGNGGGEPSNDFRFGRVRYDRRHGTARLAVWLPGPGSLRLGGKGIVALTRKGRRATAAQRTVPGQGTVLLSIGAGGGKRAALLKRGLVKVLAKVTYLPTGGSSRTKSRSLRLRLDAQPRARGGR
ncbi:MAG: choice-of-anchor D domain-containing protein [Solirubrobacterales bacterium]